MSTGSTAATRVGLVTLGCARNDVDSSELAGRLQADGYQLVTDEAEPADVIVVNTCAFVDAAKKDSIDAVLAAADTGAKVVAVGCMAERYGAELAQALPEADAVLGFDAYPRLGSLLGDVLDGHRPAAHTPVDRRTLLPISPVARAGAVSGVSVPGHAAGPVVPRTLLDEGPVAPLKIASGCDRRCTFCAIPSFRGAFVSRPPAEILQEAAWLVDQGVREVVLVSENTTSYGKDLPGDRQLADLLAGLAQVPGLTRVRLSYLQPAETRPWLIQAIAEIPAVADYFDMSFQHSSPAVLRRMRRYGSTDSFLQLVEQIRVAAPDAGIRSNVIVGFPGETEEDLAELERFLVGARLDAVGVFGYSDEDGTEALGLAGKHDEDVIAERVERITELVEELSAQRAEDRIGSQLLVMVDRAAGDPDGDGMAVGRGDHQAPDVDGEVRLIADRVLRPGELVRCTVTDSDGIDLVATVEPAADPAEPALRVAPR
ncbi:30S ribosomal protein S12 methylthiotransferase RimO [Nakamurella multipartita]|uniref:Ribosomal protein uS12 methylthiotransferase RimO n=1 Tax=Nakamurella multipartita (strain ATCC 700099 / DSM 44233 / CIP 104796 / JCM 9543 / NBRC 105858 / Y-104) TaxID=479431 RepID=C8X9J4_NAKMY|nr:30S ribosomal protein S12 methylthiotransferase RimO [Nakamurella multipartita]ACV79152.1 MiaB-like tRNA modifying enzyme YliG [Nakamurella multipartita DSM 44233]